MNVTNTDKRSQRQPSDTVYSLLGWSGVRLRSFGCGSFEGSGARFSDVRRRSHNPGARGPGARESALPGLFSPQDDHRRRATQSRAVVAISLQPAPGQWYEYSDFDRTPAARLGVLFLKAGLHRQRQSQVNELS